MNMPQRSQLRNLIPVPSVGGVILLLGSTVLVLVLGAIVMILGARIVYADQAFPGVHAGGIDLSGLHASEIQAKLRSALTYPESGLIVLHDEDRLWTATPAELGVIVDFDQIVQTALDTGRSGSLGQQIQDQLRTLFNGSSIPPVVKFDQQQASAYLSQIAAEIDLAQIEAMIGVDGVEIIMRPGQIGRQMDVPSSMELLVEPISLLHDAQIDLIVEELPPIVLDASDGAAIAREILSEPLILVADEQSWTFEQNTLAGLLTFNLIENLGIAEYSVGLSPQVLESFLTPLAEELNIPAENPKFIFNDDTGELDLLQSSVIGRELDLAETIDRIQEDLSSGDHEVAIVFEQVEPAVPDDATADELGISAPVSVVSSYFSGSGSARAHNVSTASAAFHGLLVAPGETLSMAEVLGDISLDTGYAEALIIFGDRTIKGVGGGVCQVSTTLFRAAFFGGYPLIERHPHAYRVRYYELGSNSPGPGFDATVFVPIVDFKFTNDRESWLLLETYISGSQLIWKFYSSPDSREIQWSSQQLNHEDAPESLYKENPDLPKGKIKQVDWAADGLDVLVNRTVTLEGEILYEDLIETHYLPWRAIYEYGPGTKLPEDAKTEETEEA
jgi:vancomycin resistance protein YoaR